MVACLDMALWNVQIWEGKVTSTARRVDQYWSAIVTSTTSPRDQYWSERRPVLVRFCSIAERLGMEGEVIDT